MNKTSSPSRPATASVVVKTGDLTDKSGRFPFHYEVQDLLTRLDFVPENVVMEAAQQPGLFLKVSEYRIAKFRFRLEAKRALENERSIVSLRLRRQAVANAEKITEANLEAQVTADKRVLQLQCTFDLADESDEWSKLLLEAFRMRRDCLKIVGELAGSDMAMQRWALANATQLQEARQKLEKRYPASGG